MTKRTYPYTAWVLQPSFKPKEVTIVGLAFAFWADVDKTDNGKSYNITALYPFKPAAVAAGRAKVKLLQKDIETRQETLQKRIRTLDIAEGKS